MMDDPFPDLFHAVPVVRLVSSRSPSFPHNDFVDWNFIFYHLMLAVTGVMYDTQTMLI